MKNNMEYCAWVIGQPERYEAQNVQLVKRDIRKFWSTFGYHGKLRIWIEDINGVGFGCWVEV